MEGQGSSGRRRIPSVLLAPLSLQIVMGVVAALLFAITLSPAIQVADSGELVAAACNLGVAHPPGYPLYVLMGHVLCQLPWSTPAARVGLLSAVAGVWAVMLVFSIVFRATRRKDAAMMAGLALSTAQLFWRHASLAEVFALNAALCLSVMYCALRAMQACCDKGRYIWTLVGSLAFGLALSNHHSAVFMGPLLLFATAFPNGRRWVPLALPILALGTLVGLLPYLQLLWADPLALPRWGASETLAGLWHHFIRADYGVARLALKGSWAPLSVLGAFARNLVSGFGWVFSPLLVLGVGLGLRALSTRRNPDDQPWMNWSRLHLGAFFLTPFLVGPVFLLMFNIPAAGIGLMVVERFFVLPLALFAIWVGLGLAWVVPKAEAMLAHRVVGTWVVPLGLVAALAGGAMVAYPRADVSRSYAAEDYGINLLQSVKRRALVVGTGDVRLFSVTYAQQVLGIRPDVQYVDVQLLFHRWYVRQHNRQYRRFDFKYRPKKVDSIGMIRRALQQGRPVYLANAYNGKVVATFAGYPSGSLLRLLPAGARAPSLMTVFRKNSENDRRLLRRGRAPDPLRDPWSAQLREAHAKGWLQLASALRKKGLMQQARAAGARVALWAPWLKRAPSRQAR